VRQELERVTSVKLVWIRDGVEMPIGAAAPIE
jgi:hypothetical protein